MLTLQEPLGTSTSATESADAYARALAAFEAAYANRKATSDRFNALLMDTSRESPESERCARVALAASACEDAREQFAQAAAVMNRLLIDEVLWARPAARFANPCDALR